MHEHDQVPALLQQQHTSLHLAMAPMAEHWLAVHFVQTAFFSPAIACDVKIAATATKAETMQKALLLRLFIRVFLNEC